MRQLDLGIRGKDAVFAAQETIGLTIDINVVD